jgi:hypothetical protein
LHVHRTFRSTDTADVGSFCQFTQLTGGKSEPRPAESHTHAAALTLSPTRSVVRLAVRTPSAGPLPCLPADCSPLSSKLALRTPPKTPAALLLQPAPPSLLPWPLLPGESSSPGCCCRKRAMIALSAAACCTRLLLVDDPVLELGWVRTA